MAEKKQRRPDKHPVGKCLCDCAECKAARKNPTSPWHKHCDVHREGCHKKCRE